MPLRVYLDSSDYSVLSDPAKAAREAPGVLEVLLTLRDTGQVEFFFSAAHLTEMAPIQPSYTQAAIKRGNMLVELCGGNCMVHLQSLFRAEVSVALGLSPNYFDPIDRDGKWFPEGVAQMSPVTAAERLHTIQNTIADVLPNANRAQKRQVQRKLTKGKKLRPAVQSELVQRAAVVDLSEILSTYPMRPDAARILARYFAGDASAAAATAAFESSLRDPRWMMQWFEKHHEKLTPFISWARGPAIHITEKLRELSNSIQLARANSLITAENLPAMLESRKWEEWQTNMLVGITNRFIEDIKPGSTLDAATIDMQCPGISTAIRSSHAAWRSVTFEKPRNPKESDFVDALHSMYAPYVDIFRTDAFMANHVAKQVARLNTSVVSKLSLLPEVFRQKGAIF